jgi:Trp operon repressor
MIKDKIDTLALKALVEFSRNDNRKVSLFNLLTHKEKIQVGRRILIAQAILAGKTRYEINNHLSVSPNTFSQIRKWLESELKDYSSAHQKDTAHEQPTKFTKKTFSYEHIKNNYPAHFLLFSLVEELFKIK